MRAIGMVAYYRVTLALPLVVPLAASVLTLFGALSRPGLGTLVWYSLMIGGIPYLALATPMFFWIRDKSEKAIHQVIYMSPFFMVLLLSVAVAILMAMIHGSRAIDRGLADAVATYGIFTLVIGYLYVATVQLTYLGLKALGRIALPGDRGRQSGAGTGARD